ncbi:hypothetical protein CN272_21030 [Bacillus anthracis]|uniref:hypothetical protein n=1 Tax=Bacillus wiedmannii TaxID=1890302 RepID=UPI000BF165DE|nr:hypothetical protein [Bacillus wiedmannii]PEL14812.1 hypothetical protein CN599_27175 [Bacillus wiedmannii]PFC85551.1 hypothetical protein CN272_21030 [Bacillus anthracis]PHD18378.1 hypothetical protein COF37_26665 [Bacillus wiedmannii]
MKEVMANVNVKTHPVIGLTVSWQIVDIDSGEVIRDYAFARYNFEIISAMNDVIQEIIGVCNEYELRLIDIQMKRRELYEK